MKPTAGLCIVSCVCVHMLPHGRAQYKQNGDPLVKTLLHSATSVQKLHRVPPTHRRVSAIDFLV